MFDTGELSSGKNFRTVVVEALCSVRTICLSFVMFLLFIDHFFLALATI